jgi:CysZ protein
MLSAFFKTLAALRDAYIWKTLLLCGLINSLLFATLAGISWFLLRDYLPEEGSIWSYVFNYSAPFMAAFIALLLLPTTYPLIAVLFQDKIVTHLERRHYPQSISTEMSVIKAIKANSMLLIVMVVINLLALPLYLIPFLSPIVYYFINGHLLGREFFELVGMRHHDPKEVKRLRKSKKGIVFFSGVFITFCYTFPIINLFAPVIGTVYITHFFHVMKRKEAASPAKPAGEALPPEQPEAP